MSETIQKQIQNGMLSALKAGDRPRKSALSYLLSELQSAAKSKHVGELTDADAMAVLQKQLKKVQETLEATRGGSRPESFQQAADEIAIIRDFLPDAPSAEVVEAVSRQVIAEISATTVRDMGKVIAQVSSRLPGADKSTVASVVKQLLPSPA